MSENALNRAPSRRVFLLDELRGFFILLMIVYHGLYNLSEIFRLDMPFYHSTFMKFVQLLIAGDFVLISGAVSRFSRDNMRRGLQIFGFAWALSAVTMLVIPSQAVWFGILHLLGSSMILFALLRRWLDRLHPTVGILVFTVLFLGTYFVASGFIGFPPLITRLPAAPYALGWLFWLGFPGPGFFSSDYFPLLPWVFFFFAGSYIGVYLKAGKFSDWVYRPHLPWLGKVGKHTLWIYLLHQPILYGVMLLIFSLMNR